MPTRSPKEKRVFAGGWLSDADASIMALIWQLRGPDEPVDGSDRFEAEVIRGVEKIALLTGNSVDELRTALNARFSGDRATHFPPLSPIDGAPSPPPRPES